MSVSLASAAGRRKFVRNIDPGRSRELRRGLGAGGQPRRVHVSAQVGSARDVVSLAGFAFHGAIGVVLTMKSSKSTCSSFFGAHSLPLPPKNVLKYRMSMPNVAPLAR